LSNWPSSNGQRSLFDQIPQAKVEAILKLGEIRDVKAGATFYQQEDPANSLLYLQSGRVKLYQVTDNGLQALMKLVMPGEVFGIGVLLSPPKQRVSAEAVEDSRAILWSTDVLTKIMREEPEFSRNLTLFFAHVLDELRERHIYRTTQRVEQRLAWALRTLAKHFGQVRSDAIFVSRESIQRDLADMAGTTIYTVSRILSSWERAGTLSKSRSGIVLRSPETLEQLAKLS
jgi:CRP-like cAMP-binding protein